MESTIALDHITHQTIAAVKEAAAFIQKEAAEFDRQKVQTKSLNSLVSYVDVTAEKMLVTALKNILPVAGFITEENSVEQHQKKYCWVIDPLDGTTNFIHGIPAYCVSVGLLYNDEIISGVVHECTRNESFYAWKNGGAYLNGNPIYVSKTKSLSDSLIATGFPYEQFDFMPRYMQVLSQLMQSTRGIRRLGSAALDLAYVACGRFDGFFEFNLNAWDVCGGICIVKEAGGVITDFSGGNNFLFGREIIACADGIAEELLKKISEP